MLAGAGGHCKAVIDILKGSYDIVGITDIDREKHGRKFHGVEVIGSDEVLPQIYGKIASCALVTLGSVRDNSQRKRLYEYIRGIGFSMVNGISPNAVVADTVTFGSGNVVMDRAVIHADTVLGDNIIINTGAIVEHDCVIESHVHVAVGAKLAGGVKVKEGSFIGMGACVIQGITVGKDCIVAAGTVVLDDVPDRTMVAGVPARVIRRL